MENVISKEIMDKALQTCNEIKREVTDQVKSFTASQL